MKQDETVRAHHRFWPKRSPHAIPPAESTLWHNLAFTAVRYPDRPAFMFFGRGISYSQLLDQAERVAGWLAREAGVTAGDRVLLMMQNSPQFVVAFYAAMRLRAVVVPVNPMSRAHELAHYVTDPQARVAIVSAELIGELDAAQREIDEPARIRRALVTAYADAMLDVVEPGEAGPEAWDSWLHAEARLPAWASRWGDALVGEPMAAPYAGVAEDLVALCYTSGTTGLPKGCMHTHRTIGHNVYSAPAWFTMSAADVSLGVVPMFHITGMLFVMHVPILLGATVVLMARWDRELAGRLISRHRVTTWTNIPTMIIDLLGSPNLDDFDLTSLNYIGGGGAAMPHAVAARLKRWLGLDYAEGYGLTETAAPSHSNPPDAPKLQCLGIPWIGTDARIIDPDTMREVEPGDSGEIVIHGPQVFVGYWQRPRETEEAFFELEGKRFFRTGDLGRVDEDGYFFITDRLKRMINASGFKVWPAEVENMLYHHPDIQEACVIAATDPYRGETVKAVIVLKAGTGDRVDADAIIAWARDEMAAYKVPRQIEFVDALPKSGSGKVLWRVLQAREDERAVGG
ncbi:MAG: long-chain-fatty-acid--CoA ligase [Burkholderiaceae bacterium]